MSCKHVRVSCLIILIYLLTFYSFIITWIKKFSVKVNLMVDVNFPLIVPNKIFSLQLIIHWNNVKLFRNDTSSLLNWIWATSSILNDEYLIRRIWSKWVNDIKLFFKLKKYFKGHCLPFVWNDEKFTLSFYVQKSCLVIY